MKEKSDLEIIIENPWLFQNAYELFFNEKGNRISNFENASMIFKWIYSRENKRFQYVDYLKSLTAIKVKQTMNEFAKLKEEVGIIVNKIIDLRNRVDKTLEEFDK